jgi:hypothetical protein
LLDGTGDGTFESDGVNVAAAMPRLNEGSSEGMLDSDGAFVFWSKMLSSRGLVGRDGDKVGLSDASDGAVLCVSVGPILGFDGNEGLRDGAPLMVGSCEGANDGS